ncbi:MAG: alpha/beta hydrolase [Dehalococcoidia bacterium]|nr:MAG: alpha/beta hydrolase [Dehalococcoidia bacterium]
MPAKLNEGFFHSFDGTRIYYNWAGKGLPLVCCDGIACDQYAWKYVFQWFASDYRIVRWNYRGHGKSDAPADFTHLQIADLADDLHRLLDELKLDRAVLLGHSMGTQVILEFAHRHPERVAGLVPICGCYEHPLRSSYNSDILERFLPVLNRAYENHQQLFWQMWKRFVPTKWAFWVSVLFEINHALVKYDDFMPYLEHVAEMDIGLFLTMLRYANDHSAKPYLKDIRVPTLIFAGDKDKLTPIVVQKRMHNQIPGSEMQVLPLGTHTAPIEHPDLICLRLEKFLHDLERRGVGGRGSGTRGKRGKGRGVRDKGSGESTNDESRPAKSE